MKAANEIKVGVVVVLALALIIFGYFYLRGSGLGADLYYVRLNGAANVAAGNDVRLQGVKIGQIQDVALDPTTQKPLLTLAVRRNDPPFSLYRSYQYSVKSSGIIGENYVDIQGTPRSGDDTYAANDASQVIPGKASTGIFDVSNQADRVVGDLRLTLAKFNVTLDRINKGVLSYDNQIKLTRALEGVAKLTAQASKSFGPGGVKIGLGDPRAQQALNATLINTAVAANEAGLAARDVRRLTLAAGRMVERTGGVIDSVGGVLDRAGGVLDQSGTVIKENRGQIKTLLANLDRTTTNANETISSVNSLVKNTDLNKNIQNAGASIERAAKNVEDTTATFKSLSDEQTQKDIRATLTSLRESTEALRDTARTIKDFVAEPGTQAQARSTLATLSATATTLAETSANLRDATAGLKNVLGDEKVQSDLKAIPAELRRTLEATGATAERINSLLGGRRRNRDATQSGDGQSNDQSGSDSRRSRLDTGFDFTYRYLADGRRRNFGDVRFQTELFGGPLRLGLDNIGEGTDLTLQTGRFLGDSAAIRYGLYRSKLGIGADYSFGRFSLEGNLYDPNDRSYNAYAGIRLTPQLDLIFGREKYGSVKSNAIGVRLRP